MHLLAWPWAYQERVVRLWGRGKGIRLKQREVLPQVVTKISQAALLRLVRSMATRSVHHLVPREVELVARPLSMHLVARERQNRPEAVSSALSPAVS